MKWLKAVIAGVCFAGLCSTGIYFFDSWMVQKMQLWANSGASLGTCKIWLLSIHNYLSLHTFLIIPVIIVTSLLLICIVALKSKD